MDANTPVVQAPKPKNSKTAYWVVGGIIILIIIIIILIAIYYNWSYWNNKNNASAGTGPVQQCLNGGVFNANGGCDCTGMWAGPSCEISGMYTTALNGERICAAGYNGEFCNIPIGSKKALGSIPGFNVNNWNLLSMNSDMATCANTPTDRAVYSNANSCYEKNSTELVTNFQSFDISPSASSIFVSTLDNIDIPDFACFTQNITEAGIPNYPIQDGLITPSFLGVFIAAKKVYKINFGPTYMKCNDGTNIEVWISTVPFDYNNRPASAMQLTFAENGLVNENIPSSSTYYLAVYAK